MTSIAIPDADLELLLRQLDMTTHGEHKLPADPNGPVLARLDHYLDLFVEHGSGENRWLLQARSWGTPSAQTVHDWHVRVAQVVCRLDPEVALPEAVPAVACSVPVQPVGRAANQCLAAGRRRLARSA